MLTDPQNITGSQGAKIAPRVLTGTSKGRFTSSDGSATIEIETSPSGRNFRHFTRFIELKAVTDPTSGLSTTSKIASSLIVNRPQVGVTEADLLASVKGLIGWLSAATDANLKKMLAGEN